MVRCRALYRGVVWGKHLCHDPACAGTHATNIYGIQITSSCIVGVVVLGSVLVLLVLVCWSPEKNGGRVSMLHREVC